MTVSKKNYMMTVLLALSAVCACALLIFAAADVRTAILEYKKCQSLVAEHNRLASLSVPARAGWPEVSFTCTSETISHDLEMHIRELLHSGHGECTFFIPAASKIDADGISEGAVCLLLTNNSCNIRLTSSEAISSEEGIYMHLGFAHVQEDSDTRHIETVEMVRAALAEMPEGLNDLQKAEWAHDYLLRKGNLYQSTHTQDIGNPVYDSYTLLTEGIGACRTYTQAFAMFLDEMGISNQIMFMPPEDKDRLVSHTFNCYKIDGICYFADLTWDDSLDEDNGRASGEYDAPNHRFLNKPMEEFIDHRFSAYTPVIIDAVSLK